MSEQVIERVILARLNDSDAEVHYRVMENMDEYEVDDYVFDNDLYRHTDGVLYEKTVHRYDYGGFVELTKVTPTVVEFITSYYNGGCHIDEIIGDVLKELPVCHNEGMGS